MKLNRKEITQIGPDLFRISVIKTPYNWERLLGAKGGEFTYVGSGTVWHREYRDEMKLVKCSADMDAWLSDRLSEWKHFKDLHNI